MTAKIAIYARQSDPGKKAIVGMTDLLSIVSQIDECITYAKTHFGDDVSFDIYKEQITSEVFEQREHLSGMVAHINKYQVVICWKYDRIVRDPNQLTMFCQMLRSRGVRVLSTLEQEPDGGPIGDMVMYITGTIAKMH